MTNVQTKVTFTLSTETLTAIKEAAANHRKLSEAIETIKENAFVHGYKGGKAQLSIGDRYRAYNLISRIESAIDICRTWKIEKDPFALVNEVYYINNKPVGDQTLSDAHLLEEMVKVTMFWKYEVTGHPMNTNEIKSAADLWDWAIWLMHMIQADYSTYLKANN